MIVLFMLFNIFVALVRTFFVKFISIEMYDLHMLIIVVMMMMLVAVLSMIFIF